ncbi:hypothetical protein CPLU01_13534 [Colletotrichum plurivorum]|uniref:Uncharacterized protein n=1 Tax=Colletotrichum plurivorum TaxID=2175906 RepID=A0A8H6N306_9PEZI|nr:hypothetical protein CPLU01_13534 [Colletotrichum plurivorum]
MSSLKLVIDIALNAFPPGRALTATLDALATTAQLLSYLHDKEQDPFDAFEYWLLPCGGSELVPDEVKKAFDILNTVQKCDNDKTVQTHYTVTTSTYTPNVTPVEVERTCINRWTHACLHYGSAIRVNPQWKTMTCPYEAATKDASRRSHDRCERDEFPPVAFLGPKDEALIKSGQNSKGQLVRWIPGKQNSGAGTGLFSRVCFGPEIFQRELQNITDFKKAFKTTATKKIETAIKNKDTKIYEYDGEAVVGMASESVLITACALAVVPTAKSNASSRGKRMKSGYWQFRSNVCSQPALFMYIGSRGK